MGLLIAAGAAPKASGKVANVCASDSDCQSPRKCGCDVRISCSYLRPGTFYGSSDGGHPGSPDGGLLATRCLTLDEAVEARAVMLRPIVAGRSGCDGGCYPWIPNCASDAECPRGQVCVCRARQDRPLHDGQSEARPRCSVQMTIAPELPVILHPPYSTFMCMPAPDGGTKYSY